MISLILRQRQTLCILFLLPPFILCYSRYSNAVYARIPGHRLHGYVFTTISVSDVIDCGIECSANTYCKSYNYKHKSTSTCELNNVTKAESPTAAFQPNQDYNYYEICSCVNDGTCILDESSKTIRCQCTVKYQDALCRYYKSCKHIKDSVAGVTDGPQWIDPTQSGAPFKAYCDMTNEGGGWTLVLNYIIPSSGSRPNLFVATSIPHIAKYVSNNLVIAASTLGNLRDAISFNQLRFYCRKASVGRKVHIISALNATGRAVVEYFSSLSGPCPAACGSFYTGRDDASKLSTQCSEWYGSPTKGKWSAPDKAQKDEKVYNHAFFVHGHYHFFISDPRVQSRIECDDYNYKTTPGDSWNIFVR